MQKILNSRLIYFILGVATIIGITSVFAYSIFASDIGFTPHDDTWEVDNVKGALDDLYKLATCDEWTQIEGATAKDANYVYQKVINLYKCGNVCKVTFALNNVAANTEYPLITDSNYYPKEDVSFSAIGAGNGYAQGYIYTNGKIKVTVQYNGTGRWASADNIAYLC